MSETKLSTLIQTTNEKIQLLNSHLENQGVNQFYKVPLENPSQKHISRMIQDLDYLIARSDFNSMTFEEPYQEVRQKLLEIKNYTSKEEN